MKALIAPNQHCRSNQLRGMAKSARLALASDAVVILGIDNIGRATDDFDGLMDSSGEIKRALQIIARRNAKEIFSVALFGGEDDASEKLLHSQGFSTITGASLTVEGESFGTIFGLWREVQFQPNTSLTAACARYPAIAIGFRSRKVFLSQVGSAIDSLEQIAMTVTSFPELIGALHHLMQPLMGPLLVGLMLWDAALGVLQMVPGSYGYDNDMVASGQGDLDDVHHSAARVFLTGQPYFSNDPKHDADLSNNPFISAYNIDRLMTIPLSSARGPIGVIVLLNKISDFTLADIAMVTRLSPRIATSLELTRLVFRERSRQRLDAVLTRIAVAVAKGQQLRKLLQNGVRQMARATDSTMISIVLGSADLISYRHPGVSITDQNRLLMDARRKQKLHIQVTRPQRPGDPGAISISMPVRLAGQRVGSLAVMRPRAERFDEDEMRALRRLSNLAALAWSTEFRLRQQAELTLLQERRRIADELHDYVGQLLFAAQLKLDNMLEVNELGHHLRLNVMGARALLVRGDEAIRLAVQRLSETPETDFVTRLSGTIEQMQRDFSMQVGCALQDAAIREAGSIREGVATALLRVTHEALLNVAKHSGQRHAKFSLRLSRSRLQLAIEDSGAATPGSRPSRGHGLSSLRKMVRNEGGLLVAGPTKGGGWRVAASFAAG